MIVMAESSLIETKASVKRQKIDDFSPQKNNPDTLQRFSKYHVMFLRKYAWSEYLDENKYFRNILALTFIWRKIGLKIQHENVKSKNLHSSKDKMNC